jgi:hypothetical protein
MHSNFVTPPDFIKTITVVDATPEQVGDLAKRCKFDNHSYNIYLYAEDMNNLQWLAEAVKRSDAVLVNRLCNLINPGADDEYISKIMWFGINEDLKSPVDYLDK